MLTPDGKGWIVKPGSLVRLSRRIYPRTAWLRRVLSMPDGRGAVVVAFPVLLVIGAVVLFVDGAGWIGKWSLPAMLVAVVLVQMMVYAYPRQRAVVSEASYAFRLARPLYVAAGKGRSVIAELDHYALTCAGLAADASDDGEQVVSRYDDSGEVSAFAKEVEAVARRKWVSMGGAPDSFAQRLEEVAVEESARWREDRSRTLEEVEVKSQVARAELARLTKQRDEICRALAVNGDKTLT